MGAVRRRFHGTGGGELIHGPVFHRSYAGAAGYSLKTYAGAPVRFWRAGRRVALDELGFVLVNAGEDYAFEVQDPKRTRVTTAFFDPAEVGGAWDAVARGLGAQLDSPYATVRAPEFGDWLHRAKPILPRCLAALEDAREAAAADPAVVDGLLAALLLACAEAEVRVARPLAAAAARPSQQREVRRRVSLARRFIEANLTREPSLDEMAAAACLSKYYFLRRFREVVGMTPAAYLRELRLERGAELLAAGLPVTQAALDCGYGDATAFTRAFRRRFGAPPSQAREKAIAAKPAA